MGQEVYMCLCQFLDEHLKRENTLSWETSLEAIFALLLFDGNEFSSHWDNKVGILV